MVHGCITRNTELGELLITHASNKERETIFDKKNNDGRTPLHIAAIADNGDDVGDDQPVDIVHWILDESLVGTKTDDEITIRLTHADESLTDRKGFTAFVLAAQNGKQDVVDRIIQFREEKLKTAINSYTEILSIEQLTGDLVLAKGVFEFTHIKMSHWQSLRETELKKVESVGEELEYASVAEFWDTWKLNIEALKKCIGEWTQGCTRDCFDDTLRSLSVMTMSKVDIDYDDLFETDKPLDNDMTFFQPTAQLADLMARLNMGYGDEEEDEELEPLNSGSYFEEYEEQEALPPLDEAGAYFEPDRRRRLMQRMENEARRMMD